VSIYFPDSCGGSYYGISHELPFANNFSLSLLELSSGDTFKKS